ncbi:MAG: pyridoxal phosphate-dependent aminotransferase [Chloroflexota bacterium]|nr:pyridoxal phosphate-dependent aminotransferase [Chloroflexota bacterium]
MAVAKKVRKFMEEGSWIRRMFEAGIALKRQHGERNVFDLSLGNPVVEPPEAFVRELLRLASHPLPGMHRYMPNAGYVETRQAVAQSLAEETGLPFTAGEVVMTCGAAGALNVTLKAILDPGDEVVIFSPYFVEYCYYVDNHGGVPVVVPADGRTFQPDLAALEVALGPRTRAVLINSPNNPTGVVYGADLLRQMGELLRRNEARHGIETFLLSDEPYRKLLYDGLAYPHIFPHHVAAVVATSHSKDLALPGERIGYVAVSPRYQSRRELMDALVFCNRTLGFVNAPALMQHIVRALQGVTVDVAEYQRKRDYIYGRLVAMGYQVVKPQGAFYMFPRTPIEDDVAFVETLLEWNVLVVPGRGFGTPGYFRISYCLEDWTIEGALEGLRRAARKYGLL